MFRWFRRIKQTDAVVSALAEHKAKVYDQLRVEGDIEKRAEMRKRQIDEWTAQVEREKKYPPLVPVFRVGGVTLPQYGPLFRLEYPELTEGEKRASRFEQACKSADQMRRLTYAVRNADRFFGVNGVARIYQGENETVYVISNGDLR